MARNTAILPLDLLAPLQFIRPILAAPYLFSSSVYTLTVEQVTDLQWEVHIMLLLKWPQEALLPAFPSAAALPPLDLVDHVNVSRKILLIQMVTARYQLAQLGGGYNNNSGNPK